MKNLKALGVNVVVKTDLQEHEHVTSQGIIYKESQLDGKNILLWSEVHSVGPDVIVNRCVSFFTDTILYSNQMNMNAHIDNRLQYEYYLHSVRKRKRFSKWLKAEDPDDLEFIKDHFNYSNKKAKEAIDVLGSAGVKTLKEKYSRGG